MESLSNWSNPGLDTLFLALVTGRFWEIGRLGEGYPLVMTNVAIEHGHLE